MSDERDDEGEVEPLRETILNVLREEGAAGATAFRGLPVVIEWIDGPARIERLLPRVSELVDADRHVLGVVDRADLLDHLRRASSTS